MDSIIGMEDQIKNVEVIIHRFLKYNVEPQELELLELSRLHLDHSLYDFEILLINKKRLNTALTDKIQSLSFTGRLSHAIERDTNFMITTKHFSSNILEVCGIHSGMNLVEPPVDDDD